LARNIKAFSSPILAVIKLGKSRKAQNGIDRAYITLCCSLAASDKLQMLILSVLFSK